MLLSVIIGIFSLAAGFIAGAYVGIQVMGCTYADPDLIEQQIESEENSEHLPSLNSCSTSLDPLAPLESEESSEQGSTVAFPHLNRREGVS